MAKRTSKTRKARGIKLGRLVASPPSSWQLEQLANRATFRGSGKHKTYPAPNHEWEPVWRGDAERCEPYQPEDWATLQSLLQQAIRDGFVDEELRGRFPFRAWAWVDGVLHEARLTNSATGEYHAFPLSRPQLHPADPAERLSMAPRWPR